MIVHTLSMWSNFDGRTLHHKLQTWGFLRSAAGRPCISWRNELGSSPDRSYFHHVPWKFFPQAIDSTGHRQNTGRGGFYHHFLPRTTWCSRCNGHKSGKNNWKFSFRELVGIGSNHGQVSFLLSFSLNLLLPGEVRQYLAKYQTHLQ